MKRPHIEIFIFNLTLPLIPQIQKNWRWMFYYCFLHQWHGSRICNKTSQYQMTSRILFYTIRYRTSWFYHYCTLNRFEKNNASAKNATHMNEIKSNLNHCSLFSKLKKQLNEYIYTVYMYYDLHICIGQCLITIRYSWK